MRTLVTGASGFIGARLAAALRERGHEVVALVRRPGSEPAGTEPLLADLGDGDALAAAITRARPECVVHLAAEIASQRDAERVFEVNVRGTERLRDACLALSGGDPAAGPRVVFCSTVVTGEAHGALLDEQAELPVETPYGRAKQEGERLLGASGLPVVVVRPSHVYGPGGWYAHEIVRRLRAPGRLAVIGSGRNLWDVVHVDDVVSALALAAERARPGSLYHVVDDEPISYGEFIALTAEALGVGRPRRIPPLLARAAAGDSAVRAAMRSARSSNARIKRELGWQPRYPSAREGVPAAIVQLAS